VRSVGNVVLVGRRSGLSETRADHEAVDRRKITHRCRESDSRLI